MRVLINRSDAIGDTILTIPMAEVIKNHSDSSKVVFITKALTKPLFKNNPYVDDVWDINDSELRKKINTYGFDAYIYVGGSHRPSLYSFLSRIKLRAGLKSKWPSYLFLNKANRQKRSQIKNHELAYNLLLLEQLGITFSSDHPGPKLYLDDNIKKENTIIVHPGMTGHTLNWPLKNYAMLLKKIMNQYGARYNVLVSYTQSDIEHVNGVKQYLGQEDINKICFYDGGHKGLWEFIQKVKKASLFIGPSTGTTHIANTVGTKVLTFYSPIKSQSEKRWGPFYRTKNMTELLVPEVHCEATSKCLQNSCPSYECMGKISVDMAFEKVCQLLEN
ncbi:MAG: glycosyltransferase family 9 protein [Bacteriovoracaceae bacterium]